MAVYGEIFSLAGANQTYGSVLESVSISTKTLEDLMTQSTKCLMFKIISGAIYVLDDQRGVIYPAGQSVGDTEVFTMFSKSIIKNLISKGGDSDVYIEQRSDVLTATNGAYTMETGAWCPPICTADDEA